MKKIQIKRIYQPPAASMAPGFWWIGSGRAGWRATEARIDAWIKDVASSDALRRWYSHDAEKWPEFRARYIAGLKHDPAVVELQDKAAKSKTITLLFAALSGGAALK